MADQYILCLIGAMDHLWFNRTVLFSEPTPLHAKTLKPTQPTSSESLTGHSSSSSLSPPEEEEKSSSDSSPFTPPEDGDNVDEKEEEMNLKERPTRSTQKHRLRKSRHSNSMITLQKTMRCRSLWELELEEVKGFMDLGFIFEKEHLNPRMMSVVPGLQRVGLYKNKQNPKLEASHEIIKDDENEEEEGILRPYLSEAWLIKRPDSALLKLRMPSFSASADTMKQHLRFWAKTVASTVHQDCSGFHL